MSAAGSEKRIEDVIVVGSGPAGYTAALYTARADLEPLVIEGFQWGGLLQQTTDVENYPGYPEGVMGPEMMQQFRAQAERFGTRFVTDDATRVELSDGGVQRVWVGDEEYRARSVVLAMGADPRKLGVPGEDELASRGVSYCATCDAAFYRGKRTIIVGGGDTAMEEATFLAKFAADVKVVHRRDEFRASAIMLDRARETENIELLTSSSASRPATAGCWRGRYWRAPTAERIARSRSTAPSSRSATRRTPSSSPTRSRWTTTATSRWRAAPAGPAWVESSPPAT
jgi:thioredoxin reductase (NADPH)